MVDPLHPHPPLSPAVLAAARAQLARDAGSTVTPCKSKAARRNLKKARAKRWAFREIGPPHKRDPKSTAKRDTVK